MSSEELAPATWLRRQLSLHADARLQVASESFTYADADMRSDQLAAGFQALGLGRGDCVCVLLDNRREALDTWFGLLKAGAIEVPVNINYRGQLLHHILSQSRATAVVVGPEFYAAVLPALEAAPGIRHIIVDGSTDGLSAPAGRTLHRLADLYLDSAPKDPRRGPTDPTVVMYTSGTTGPSKGVVGTHAWSMGISDDLRRVMGYTGADRLYSMFAIYYVNARYAALFPALSVGAGFVLDTRFSASRFWDICREKEITAFNYLGAVVPILWKQPERPDDADNPVRIAFGAACPLDVWDPFEKRFGLHLVEGYGMTEVGLATCNTPAVSRLGSAGKPLGGYEIELHDEDGYRVSEGQPGEAVLRPKKPGIMFQGYYNMPDETLETFRNLWLHTGDRLRCDEDGFYYFVDRVKESMRRRGLNVSSWEVEQVVNQHEDVLESAAYGVPSELAEDEIAIAVVPREGHTIDPAKLVEHCRAGMADFAVPRYVRVVAELPKTPSQRIEKYKLKAEGITSDSVDCALLEARK